VADTVLSVNSVNVRTLTEIEEEWGFLAHVWVNEL